MAKRPGTGSSKITLSGDKGPNTIDGGLYSAADQARGFIIKGNGGDDDLTGGSGADLLYGGTGNDVLHAHISDLLGVPAGTVVYDGGTGYDTLDLSALPYSEGNGIFVQSVGRIWTDVQKDDTRVSIYGEPELTSAEWSWIHDMQFNGNFSGIENYTTGGGDDLIYMISGSGNNVIHAGAGNDWVSGGDGDDLIYGEDGNDILSGSWGNNTLWGGAGNDAFMFAGRLGGEYQRNTIEDFNPRDTPDDASFDQIWMGQGWTITWDPNSSDVLHGYLRDGDVIFGEVTVVGLTFAQAAQVPIFSLSDYPVLV